MFHSYKSLYVLPGAFHPNGLGFGFVDSASTTALTSSFTSAIASFAVTETSVLTVSAASFAASATEAVSILPFPLSWVLDLNFQ